MCATQNAQMNRDYSLENNQACNYLILLTLLYNQT